VTDETLRAVNQGHELKCWPEFFRFIENGQKTFEIRKDDRGFHVGDVLWLREWRRLRIVNGLDEGEYTGREVRRVVTYVLSGWGLEQGYVCLAVGPQVAQEAPSVADEEFQPHAFVQRYDEFSHSWCAQCEYHRDHEIHVAAAPPREDQTP
jgi:hypothetical protein